MTTLPRRRLVPPLPLGGEGSRRPGEGNTPRGEIMQCPKPQGKRSAPWGSDAGKRSVLFLIALACFPAVASAHPVPKSNHDRTVVVRLRKTDKADRLQLRVDYRLEVDEGTVLLDDMQPFRDEVDPAKYVGKPLEFYGEFAKIYGPLLANNLIASTDTAKNIPFECVDRKPTLHDEKDEKLGHLRCDFVFVAEIAVSPDRPTTLKFRENTYLMQEGQLRLSFADEAGVRLSKVVAPDEELIKRPLSEQRVGDEDRLREIEVVFRTAPAPPIVPATEPKATIPEPAKEPVAVDPHADDALRQLVFSERSFWLIMLLAFFFGAAHALTPGHGKTLVAAYLVGERGTMTHALVLGLSTTLTHTGAVLILAAVAWFLPSMRQFIQAGLGITMGLIIVLMGFYLLVQRLAGRPDHVHFGGDHGHGHGHGHGDGFHSHSHAHGGHSHGGVTWTQLILLGMSGGIIPCWDAVLLLLWSIGSDKQRIAFPALLAFSLGLAAVLVAVGMMVVKVRAFADSKFGEGKWTRKLSIASAVAIILLGFYLCKQSVG
jgi:nickel/cobalt exporter